MQPPPTYVYTYILDVDVGVHILKFNKRKLAYRRIVSSLFRLQNQYYDPTNIS